MSIRISEKDFLFVIINCIGLLAWISYLCLDFISFMAQLMAAADPQYANIEVGFSLIRVIAYAAMVSIGVVILSCDLWWGYRIWKVATTEYWRENL